jgi:elongation factor 1-gamma
MSYTIYSYPDNFRVAKTLIAAQYAGIEIEVPNFEFGKDNKTPSFLAKNPLGKVPVMDTPHGPLFESGAMQRYVGRLRPEAGLYGSGFYQSGLVDQWLDFITTEVDTVRGSWLYPIMGYIEFDQDAYDQAKKDMKTIMSVLDKHFLRNTFLVGNQITLADIALTTSLVELYRRVFCPEFVAEFANVSRWFTLCIHQTQFESILGRVEFAKQEERAPKAAKAKKEGGGKPKEEVAPKEEKAKEPKKEKESEAKKGKTKETAEKPKEKEKEKEGEKPAKAKKESDNKTKVDEGKKKEKDTKPKDTKKKAEEPMDADAIVDAEAKLAKKEKNPLDSLPESKMIMDSVKKLFFSEKPFNKTFFSQFWNIFDPAGYCIYTITYKFDDENKILFMTGNAVGGFIQRAENVRKYAFGTVMIVAKDEDSPPLRIVGSWIFRGSDIPKEMQACDDYSYYNWTKVDTSKNDSRKRVESLFTANALGPYDKGLYRRYLK